MFTQNKYSLWYNNIINFAKSQQRNKTIYQYFENHHILPTSLGGNNTKDNLVLLTAREHFICHLLLTKMTEGNNKYKMQWALHRMTFSKIEQRKFSSHQYNLARKYYIDCVKKPKTEEHKKKIGAGNKGKIVKAETKLKISLLRSGTKASQETKQKMSDSRRNRIFISNDNLNTSKQINQSELLEHLNNGWYVGRTKFNAYSGSKHSDTQKEKWSLERKGCKQPIISEKKKGMVNAIDMLGNRHYVHKEEFDKRDDLFGIRNSKVKHLL